MPARLGAARFQSHVAKSGHLRSPLFIFFAALYGAGFFCGAVSLLFFSAPVTRALSLSFQQAGPLLLHYATASSSAHTEFIIECLLLLIVWVASQLPVFPLGGLLLTGVCFLRAATVGLCASELLGQFGWRGAGFDLLALLPWNILTGGGIVLACAVGYAHARRLRKMSASQIGSLWWLTFHGAYVGALGLLICATWLEGAISSPMAHLFAL